MPTTTDGMNHMTRKTKTTKHAAKQMRKAMGKALVNLAQIALFADCLSEVQERAAHELTRAVMKDLRAWA